MRRTFRFFLCVCVFAALGVSAGGAETDCSATVKFVERGHAKTVSRVGSPLATLRHRLAQRALARAMVRAQLAEAAATRPHASHVSHGAPAAATMAEADCSVSALPPVPAESK